MKINSFLFLILSSALLVLSFPKFNMSFLAWVALVPFMFALDGKTPRRAFQMGYCCGVFFFGATLWWLGHVTIIGMIAIVLYLSLYFGMFGLGYVFLSGYSSAAKIWILPSLWVFLEWARSYLFTGFDWVSLSHSQQPHLLFIQIADMTGVFGVSFLVVMVNVAIKEYFTTNKWGLYGWLVCGVLLGGVGYGFFRLYQEDSLGLSSIKIAVIQANIAQELKWNKMAWKSILNQHLDLSERAARERPDLIVWPETSFPGFIGEDEEYFVDLRAFVKRVKIPVLFGSVVKEGDSYYNGALLLSSDGVVRHQYYKKHLVPFGEFIPFRAYLPFLSDIVAIEDFSSGREYTVFPVKLASGDTRTFSVLICFEDTFGRLARGFVNKGAQMLINMTNDAWFKDTAAPWMHMQSAVFRTVETRRSLVRAANTGLSVFIESTGKIRHILQDDRGHKTFNAGYLVAEVDVRTKKTFYTKFGDVFAYLCFGCILGSVINVFLKKRILCRTSRLE